jgi:Cu+-exporting ATPase
MNSLVVLGTSAAWAWSTLVTFAPSAVPEVGRHVYFEAAAVIVTLILLGRWLEARARGHAGAAIAGLIALRPDTAPRLDITGTPRDVALVEVTTGDTLLLRPGARVAVDGIVETGESHVDEAMLTGEPLPVTKAPGDPVTAGTVNGSGSLTYRATAVGTDTVLARIVAMVEDAQSARLPVQALIDRVTAVFVPVVLIVAVLAGGSVAFPRVRSVQGPGGDGLGPDHRLPLRHGPRDACLDPRRHGARGGTGVLFRQGSALQALGGVDLIAFDKTGTLTEGRPQVVALHPASGTTPGALLGLAASAEAASEHPLARAIEAEARARGLPVEKVSDFENTAGRGVVASLGRCQRSGRLGATSAALRCRSSG